MKERIKFLKEAIKPLIILIASSLFVGIIVLLGDKLEDMPFFFLIGIAAGISAIVALVSFFFILIDFFQFLFGNKYEPSLGLLYILNVIVLSISSIFILGENVNVCFIVVFSFIFSCLTIYLYFLPYFIAVKNEHLQERAIYILNFFAGWTIIAWIIALIWANTSPKEKIIIEQKSESNADELKKYKELLDSGIITQEEFDAKKKQLLGL